MKHNTLTFKVKEYYSFGWSDPRSVFGGTYTMENMYPIAIAHGPNVHVAFNYEDVPDDLKQYVGMVSASRDANGVVTLPHLKGVYALNTIVVDIGTIWCIRVYHPEWDREYVERETA